MPRLSPRRVWRAGGTGTKGNAMRDIPTILEEWRTLERELDAVRDRQARTLIILRIETIRAEHAAAVEAQADKADDLGSLSPIST